MNVADNSIVIYHAECALFRVDKMTYLGKVIKACVQVAIVKLYFYELADKIIKFGKDAIHSFVDGDEARMMIMGLKRFTKVDDLNPKALRQQIAQDLIDKGTYTI